LKNDQQQNSKAGKDHYKIICTNKYHEEKYTREENQYYFYEVIIVKIYSRNKDKDV
jgi:hypothetical protein